MNIIRSGAIVAAAAIGFATSASAEALLWDGSLVITSTTSQCQAIGEDFSPTQSLRALWRPRLKASDPAAAIIFQTDNLSHIYVVRAATTVALLNGRGRYIGIDFDPGLGESTTWFGGTYNITATTLTGAAATAGAPQVRVTGVVTRFGDIAGCTAHFRGAFLSRPALD